MKTEKREKNEKGYYPSHVMPAPSVWERLEVAKEIPLPVYEYTAGHLTSDLISMFEHNSPSDLHGLVHAWEGNAILKTAQSGENYFPARARRQAVEFFTFFHRFRRTALYRQILDYTADTTSPATPQPVAAAKAFLAMLAAEVQGQGGSGNTTPGLALSGMLDKAEKGIHIPFLPPGEGGKGAGSGHPELLLRMWSISDILSNLQVEYQHASQRTYVTREVSYPDDEVEYAQMRSYGDVARIVPSQFMLPDSIFYQKLAAKELLVTKYFERIQTPRNFVMLIDVSGSMKEKMRVADGHTRADYAIASAISLLQHALAGANTARIVLFDAKPHPALEGTPAEVARQLLSCPFSGGGTSIDAAVRAADETHPDEIILITDGDDRVSYHPTAPLLSYLCGRSNTGLKKISESYKEVKE